MVKILETAKKLDYREQAARKLEAYKRGGGGMDTAQMAQMAQMVQLTQMMGAGMGMGMGMGAGEGMGAMIQAMQGGGAEDNGYAPHELAIHAQLCDGWENFCKVFPCGEQERLNAPEDEDVRLERERRAREEREAAVAAVREEERATHAAQLVAMRAQHAAALKKRGEEERAALEGAHAAAIEKERRDCGAAVAKAVEEARHTEQESIYGQSVISLVRSKWGRVKASTTES